MLCVARFLRPSFCFISIPSTLLEAYSSSRPSSVGGPSTFLTNRSSRLCLNTVGHLSPKQDWREIQGRYVRVV